MLIWFAYGFLGLTAHVSKKLGRLHMFILLTEKFGEIIF
jgi:hypothetical protein